MSVPNMRLYRPLGTMDTLVTTEDVNLSPSQPGVIQIESEQIHYVSCDPNDFYNCTRGYNGTTAATHAAGVTISFVSTDDATGVGDLLSSGAITVANGSQTLAGQSATIGVNTAQITGIGAQTQDLNMNSHKISNVAAPVAGGDAANKTYVDGHAGGGSITSYTPTLVGFGTTTSVQFFYKSDGVSVEVWGSFIAGTVTVASATVTLPVAPNASHLPTIATIVGDCLAGSGTAGQVRVFYDGSDTTQFYFNMTSINTPTQPFAKATGGNFADNNDYLSVHFSYPIA